MSKTQLVWKPSQQKVDLSTINNPLAKTKNKLTNRKVDDLVDEMLDDKKYKNVIDFYKTNKITFDINIIPKFEKHPLRDYLTPEEVQRLMDHSHNVNILQKFDPRLLSPIYVVRLNGKPNLFVFDSMHTLTNVAAIAKEGLWGNDPDKWLDFEYPCWVIDTDDESFPMVAALYRNGEGSKPWGPYDYHRVFVRSFDFYNIPGPNDKYKLAFTKQQLMVKNNAVPLPKGHPDLGMLGTLGHIEAVTKIEPDRLDELTFILETNNKYWNGNNDSSMFGFYGNLFQGFKNVGQPTSGPDFDKFLDEIHALIKHFFVSMDELRTATTQAYKEWMQKQGKVGGTVPFNCVLAIVLKIYKKLNGQYPVPSDVNMFVYSPSANVKIDIYDSLPLNLRQNVNNYCF